MFGTSVGISVPGWVNTAEILEAAMILVEEGEGHQGSPSSSVWLRLHTQIPDEKTWIMLNPGH